MQRKSKRKYRTDKPLKNKRKLRKPYTVREIRSLARKCKTRSEFGKRFPGAYLKSIKLELLDSVSGHMRPVQQTWTKERVIREAQRYSTRYAFQRGSSKAYHAAFRRGWIDAVCKHMPRSARVKYTKASALRIARKYKTKRDWREKDYPSYRFCMNHGYYKLATRHMKPVGSKYRRALYAFEFIDKSVYIGLTYDLDRRFRDHMREGYVGKLIGRGRAYEFKVISNYIAKEKAARMEASLIKSYARDGWKVLNRAMAGSLGGIDRKWTEDKVLELAGRFGSLTEFMRENPSAYSAALKGGYLKKLHKILPSKNRPRWTKSELAREIRAFTTVSELRESSPHLIAAAQRLGCYRELAKGLIRRTNAKWTVPLVKKEIRKYSYRSDFRKRSPGAYHAVARLRLKGYLNRALLKTKPRNH